VANFDLPMVQKRNKLVYIEKLVLYLHFSTTVGPFNFVFVSYGTLPFSTWTLIHSEYFTMYQIYLKMLFYFSIEDKMIHVQNVERQNVERQNVERQNVERDKTSKNKTSKGTKRRKYKNFEYINKF